MQRDIEVLLEEIAALHVLESGRKEAATKRPKKQEKDAVKADETCPVCFGVPSTIFCCRQCDNMVCGACVERLTSCPLCRQDFADRVPMRNKYAERLLNVKGS